MSSVALVASSNLPHTNHLSSDGTLSYYYHLTERLDVVSTIHKFYFDHETYHTISCLTLLIYLSLDLTIFGCSKTSNMITLSTSPVPEIDLSMTLEVIEKL